MRAYQQLLVFIPLVTFPLLQWPSNVCAETDLSDRLQAVVCVNFNDHELFSYGGSEQDVDVTQHETKNAGTTLHLWGNNWKAIKQPYLVTPYTVIEFDFYSDGEEGGINSIGIDEDLMFGTKRQRRTRRARRRQAEAHYQIYGTEIFGHQTFRDNEQDQWRHYTIPIGQTVRGRMRYLVLGNDADFGQATSVHYRSIVIYEDRDGDRLPDNWEIRHFGDLNQAADDDLDADQVTHRREYEAGTDPKHDLSPYIPLIQGHLYGLTWTPPPANTPNLVEMMHAKSSQDPVVLAQQSRSLPKGAAAFLIRGWDPWFMLYPADAVQTPDGKLTNFRSPWLNTAATKTQQHVNQFMNAYKEAGGVLDSVILDAEDYLSNWNSAYDLRRFLLTAGQHTLRITEKDPAVLLDGILFTDESDFDQKRDVRQLFGYAKIWIEAENTSTVTGLFTTGTDPNASGQSYLTIPNGAGGVLDDPSLGGYAEYTFNVPVNGSYFIWGKTLTDNNGDDSVYVSVDNRTPDVWSLAHGGQWWLWDQPSRSNFSNPRWYELAAGQHTLRITQREDGIKIDQFLITNDPYFAPHPMLSGEKTKIWIEAEKHNSIQAPMVVASSNQTFEGQYVHTPAGAGDNLSLSIGGQVEYTFDISTTRNYYLWARVLAATDGGDSFWVSADNGPWIQWNTFTSNAAWQWRPIDNLAHSNAIPFSLQAGRHTLKIKHRDAGVGIDKILITDDPSFTPSSTFPAAVWIEAEHADFLNPPMAINQDSRASNSNYIWIPENKEGPGESHVSKTGYADYTFTIPENGIYFIKGIFKAPKMDLHASWGFEFSLDGQAPIRWATQQRIPIAPKWHWNAITTNSQRDHIFAIRDDPRSGPLNAALGFSTDLDYVLVNASSVGATTPLYVLDQDDLGQLLLQQTPRPQFLTWNANLQGIASQFLHKGFYPPVSQYYPNIKMSNYSDRAITKEHAIPLQTRLLEYNLSSFGTHQSNFFYGILADLLHRDVLQPDGTFKKFGTQPFSALLRECNQIRAGLRSARRAWQPWIPRKNWGNPPPATNQTTFYTFQNSDIYNELIYHLALSGTEDFLYWNSFPTIGDPMTDDLLVDQLLTEINQKFANQIRQPVTPEKIPWSSNAVVSGTQLGRDSILWRVSVPEGTAQVRIKRFGVLTQGLIKEQIMDLNGSVGIWVETRINEKITAEAL